MHEQIENEFAGVAMRALDLLDVATLSDAVNDLLCERAAHVASALSHHVEVLARVENLLGCALQEERHSLRADGVVLLPVRVVVVLLQLLLLERSVLLHQELTKHTTITSRYVTYVSLVRRSTTITCDVTSSLIDCVLTSQYGSLMMPL